MENSKYNVLPEESQKDPIHGKDLIHREKYPVHSVPYFKLSTVYNPDQIPPNWDMARIHAEARRVLPPGKVSDHEVLQHCDCCRYIIKKDSLGICCSLIDLSFLGAGYPLLFQFIKNCIYMLLITFVISGIFNCFGNYNAKSCVNKKLKCMNDYATYLSLANAIGSKKTLMIERYLNFANVILLICFLQIFRRSQRKFGIEIDEKIISPADFTLKVKGIKPSIPFLDYQETIANIFNKIDIPGVGKTKVVKLEEFERQKNKWIKEKQKALKYYNKKGSYPEDYDPDEVESEILRYNKGIERLEKNYSEGKELRFCGMAFVTLERTEMAKEIIKLQKMSMIQRIRNFFITIKVKGEKYLGFYGRRLFIEKAYEPSDVYWRNCHVPVKIRLFHRVQSWVITLTVLFIGFIIATYLTILQNNLDKKAKQKEKSGSQTVSTLETLLGLFISLIVEVFNIFLEILSKKFTKYERYSTKTRHTMSLVRKLSFLLSVSVGGIPFIISLLFTKNYYRKNGLIANLEMFYYLYLVFLIIFFGLALEPLYKWYERRSELKKGDKSVLTQKKANKLMEPPSFPIQDVYAIVLSIMYITFFFAPLIPIFLVISIVFLAVFYWIIKFYLLKRLIFV